MSEAQPRSHWSSGFLWGCLTPLAIVGILIAGLLVYSGYYMLAGFKNDSSLQTVTAAIQHNAVARAVLGDHIAIRGVPSYNFRQDLNGRTASYSFELQGDKASASAHADVTISGGQTHIRALTLTGPDGRIYDLLGSPGLAPSNAVWLLNLRRMAANAPDNAMRKSRP